MKTKLTKTEKIMFENQKKIMEEFEKSGWIDMMRSELEARSKLEKAIQFPSITLEDVKKIEDWQKNKRPKWKANKEIQRILDDFLNSPPSGKEHNDILNEIGKIVADSRDKKKTKDQVDGGTTYKQKQKLLDALDIYERLVASGMNKLTAKNRVKNMKKFNWSLGTLKKYLTKARKLRQQ